MSAVMKTMRSVGVYFDQLGGRVEEILDKKDGHVCGFRRLYWKPTLLMMIPRMMYKAAVRNTGAAIVVVILFGLGG